MAFLIPSIQFFFGLPRALFCFGIHCNAILGNLPSAMSDGNVTLCRGQQVVCVPRVGRTSLRGETGAEEVVLHSIEVSYKVSRTLRNPVEQHQCRVLGPALCCACLARGACQLLLQKQNENQCLGLTQGHERPALLLRRTAYLSNPLKDGINTSQRTQCAFIRKTSRYEGKAIPFQAWTGPEGFKRLRLPDFKTIGT